MKLFLLPAALMLAAAISQSASAATAYQKHVEISCDAIQCNGSTPAVPAGETLNLVDISCFIVPNNAKAVGGFGQVVRYDQPTGFSRAFMVNASGDLFAVAPVQIVPFQVPAGRRLAIDIVLSGRPLGHGHCDLHGTLVP